MEDVQVADTVEPQQQDIAPATPEAAETETAQETATYNPFSSGFKINGQEEEGDWETTKRDAQLGKAGQLAMQQKAESERKQKDFFSRLLQGLEADPAATYEALTGKKAPFSVQRMAAEAATAEQGSELNPLELRLRQTEERLAQFQQQQEAAAIEQEKAAIEQELNDASQKFPEISTPWLKSYVKQQYKALLQQGIFDMSIEDVSFLVSEEVKKQNAEKQTALINKVETNKKKAVVDAPRGTGSEDKKAMSLEDVKRLAGRL